MNSLNAAVAVSLPHISNPANPLHKVKKNSFDEYLHTVLYSTREAICVLTLKGEITLWNEPARKIIFQFTDIDIRKTTLPLHALHKSSNEIIQDCLGSANKGEFSECEFSSKKGNWIKISFFPAYNDEGIVEEVCCTLKDITAKKKQELSVKVSEEMHRSLIESMMEGVVFQSVDKKGHTANDSAARILGISKRILIRDGLLTPLLTFIDEKEQPVDLGKYFCEKLKKLESVRNCILGIKKENSITWLKMNAEPVKNEQGDGLQGCVFTFTDITDALKNKEELNLLSKVIKETSNMVVITDKDEKIIWANDSFCKTSEYNLDEAINKRPGHLLYGPDKDKREIEKIKKALRKGNAVGGELLNYTKSGKKYWANYHIHPVKDEHGNLVRFFSIQSDITETKRIREEMVEHQLKHKEQIANAIISAQENKQTEIGQELHDNINQILAVTKLFTGLIMHGQGDLQENAVFVSNHIQLAIDEIRKLSHQLVAPNYKEKDLVSLLNELTNAMRLHIPVELIMSDVKEAALCPEIRLAIFRIVQEQLTNIQKHAHATNILIEIKQSKEMMLLLIEDDGIGFDLSKQKNGIGMSNICNRAETLNGTAVINSSPGKGCQLLVTIPFR